MRKFIFFNLLLWAITSDCYCQDKATNFYIPKNQDYTVTTDGYMFTAADVLSARDKMVRKIVMTQPNSRTGPSEILIELESTNLQRDLYDQLQNSPSTFCGTMKLIMNGTTLSTLLIINGQPSGQGQTSRLYSEPPAPVYNPNLPCTLRTVHDCVAFVIEGMNWLEYGVCMIRAPVCYLAQWTSCFRQVCRNHMQYTNPN
jgi:hypothetical protein